MRRLPDAMAPPSPSSAPAKKRIKWLRLRGNKKVMDTYLDEARAALAAAAAQDADDAAATAALHLATAALEMSPRAEAALELRARALLALRRYRDVADMLREYIPSSCSCSGGGGGGDGDDDLCLATTSSSSSAGSGAQLLSPHRKDRSDAVVCCLDVSVSGLKRRLAAAFFSRGRGSSSSSTVPQWRYLVLGQACFHLGLMDDAALLLQAGRRLATASSRRQSVRRSEDSFSPSPSESTSTATTTATTAAQLLAHVKLLLRRRAAAVAALDAGLPGEAVRHFSKALDTRRSNNSVLLPHPFATACLVGRAAAFRAAGRPADAVADCNRALALDPGFVPALRARADLLESVGALPDCLRDLDHLKLLYDAALRDGRLPGPTWRPQGGVRFGEIAGAHRELTARIQLLRSRVAGAEGVDYYALLGVRRGCSRSELERAHLVLTLKLKPERSASFAERVELVDEHRDLDAVRDQARMSALFLYRMLHKGYSSIMAAVLDDEAVDRQRATKAEREVAARPVPESSAALATTPTPNTTTKPPVVPIPMPVPMHVPRTATPLSPAFQGVSCRDSLLSRGGFDRPIPVKCEAMSC